MLGMRDEAVSARYFPFDKGSHETNNSFSFFQQFDRANKLRNLGQRPRNMLAKAEEGDRAIKTKMIRFRHLLFFFLVPAQASVHRETQGRQNTKKIIARHPFLSFGLVGLSPLYTCSIIVCDCHCENMPSSFLQSQFHS